ncbi:putative leucine-rich repeat domain, L domain-containing protein [Medicago truncatula]|nr:putative leucine-rich repeat domain, L domain-containing protein [Medicago truncatula]
MPFFDKLTYLEWNGYPLKSLPEPFHAEQLIQISLPHSNIEHLWYGMQELVNLEAIDLSECKQLRHLPDLSGALKLKQLRLSGCEELCEVRPSAFSKDTLDTLLLDRCTKLESLMGEKHLTSLKYFSVKGCKSLKEFSLSSDSINRLDLSKTGIKILHPSIGDMNNLIWLNLEDLNLTNLPIELSHLRSLTELRVSKCNVVTKSKLEALFEGLTLLRLLHLKDCCNLIELPANISSLESLHELRLDGSSVEELPASIKYLSELEIQSLDNCSKLRCLPELPLSIKEFQADNCTSLITVSTLKTFSINMIGQKKYISFKNSIMLELDGPSLDRITEDAMLTMKSAAFHNVLVRKYRFQTHSFNYNRAEVCLPGRRVPREIKHQSTTSSSITINISNSLGFIFAVVVSPSKKTQQHGYFVGMRCQCYTEDGKREVGYKSKWDHKPITSLNMDHVFVWYDPYHYDSILSSIERKISFKFCITTYTSSGKELDGLLSIKECGVCPIYYSESRRVLGTGNLDKKLELELYEEIQFESRSGEGYDEGDDEKEGTGIQNQQSDLNENFHSSYECLIACNDTQVHENPQQKETLDDDDNSKEIMKFKIVHESSAKSGDETETSSNKHEQFEKEKDSTGGDSDVESSFDKRQKFSSDDDLHSSISPTRLNSTDRSKTDEETKNLQQSPPPLVKNLQIPSYSYTNKLNPNASMAAESSSSKPSKDSEYSPIDYSEYKKILEEDPLAIMEKLLSGELGHSSQASQSTPQAEATETQSESIKMLLDELRDLVFSRNLLKHLPNDVTLGEEVKALLVKLNYRANELSEKQSSGITDFARIFTEATVNIDEGKLGNVTLQHLNVDHKDSMSKLQASKYKIMKFDESISAAEDKIKARDVEIEDIKAQIRLLEEKARKVQQEKSQLEDACSKCKEKRTEIVEEAKNVASTTIQTREKIDNLKKKKRELDSNYETLEGNYAIMRLSPPF